MSKKISDPILSQQIGCGIRNFRKKLYAEGRKTFTQQGCADKIGVKQQQWAAWESGKSNPPSPANQRKIAELLEVSLAELRGEALPPPVAGEENERRADLLHGAALIRYHLDVAQDYMLRGGLSADAFSDLTVALLSVIREHLAAHGKTLRSVGDGEAG